MYQLWDPRNPDVREKVYGDVTEYGIVCRIQDLKEIVDRIDKFLKRTKVRGQGLCKRFGQINGIPGVRETQWTEWVMDAKVWTVERGGEFVSTDSPDVRRKREEFFEALLSGIGFPLETLHVYDREERERRYTLSGD